jgi:hypothetical protein
MGLFWDAGSPRCSPCPLTLDSVAREGALLPLALSFGRSPAATSLSISRAHGPEKSQTLLHTGLLGFLSARGSCYLHHSMDGYSLVTDTHNGHVSRSRHFSPERPSAKGHPYSLKFNQPLSPAATTLVQYGAWALHPPV